MLARFQTGNADVMQISKLAFWYFAWPETFPFILFSDMRSDKLPSIFVLDKDIEQKQARVRETRVHSAAGAVTDLFTELERERGRSGKVEEQISMVEQALMCKRKQEALESVLPWLRSPGKC
jgi:hypothetical protein